MAVKEYTVYANSILVKDLILLKRILAPNLNSEYIIITFKTVEKS